MTKLKSIRCLVTGGAGYIGSHVVDALRAAGATVTVLDNFYSGHRWAVPDTPIVEGDVGNASLLTSMLSNCRFDAVLHFAGHIWVGESIRFPSKYYRNNTKNSIELFAACYAHGIHNIIFSSTAAVYGSPTTVPIVETAPLVPINPYGTSKMMAERVLQDLAPAHGAHGAILRYFNVAGAHDQGHLGEATPTNSHLIKVACETAMGLRPRMHINGDTYPTTDGTCVRDYVHVQDLAEAHVATLAHLLEEQPDTVEVMNCGYGHGYSVREVLDAFRRVTGTDLAPVVKAPRRGDPPVLVADNRKILDRLDWRPRRDDLELIIRSAWRWEQQLQGMVGA